MKIGAMFCVPLLVKGIWRIDKQFVKLFTCIVFFTAIPYTDESEQRNSIVTETGLNITEHCRQTICDNVVSLRYAYTKRLRAKPEIRGKVKMEININPAGTVINCKCIISTISDKVLIKEIIKIIKTWKFDPLRSTIDDQKVTYTFNFEPEKESVPARNENIP